MKKSHSVRSIILVTSLVLQLNLFCFHSYGAAGDVDLSFDPGSGVNGTVNAVVVQPDGKVVIGGQFTTVKGLVRTNLARLNADGSGDSSFISGRPNNPVYAVALQPDGKVLVGSEGDNFSLTRLNPDVSPDTNFNSNAQTALSEQGWSTRIYTIILQPDGKLLAGGYGVLFRLNSDGTFDNGFSAFYGSTSFALQADGKVITGGYFYDPVNNTSSYGLVRLNSNGSLDGSFNATAGNNAGIDSIVLQPDGKVLVGGGFIAVNGTSDGVVARVNANGSLDTNFTVVSAMLVEGIRGFVEAVALQPDGKIVIGGKFDFINGNARSNLARLNTDGSLDVNFPNGVGGVGGFPMAFPGTSVKAIALQTNGTVFIGGAFTTVNGTNRNCMARLNSDGSLDAAFQPGQGVDPISSLVVQPDGKVLIGGVLTFINGTNRYGSARLNANGSLDGTFIPGSNFNPSLAVFIQPGDCPGNPGYGCYQSVVATVVLAQADGKVLVGGYSLSVVTGDEVYWPTVRYFLGRFNADGSPDPSFEPALGSRDFWADYWYGWGSYPVSALAAQPDGKIVLSGYFTSINGTNRNGIARLNANGSLDTTFNPDAGAGGRWVYSVALQADGKVFIGGGFTTVNGTNRNGIARLNANGSLDGSFNPGTGASGGSVFSVELQPDGKVFIGGAFTTVNGTSRNRIARLNADGSLDSSFNPGTGADGNVHSMAMQSKGDVLIGGDFLSINGVVRPHVARLYGDAVVIPSVNIARSNAFVIVSWPVTGLNFQLQETTNLALLNSWSPVAQSAVTNAGQISVSFPTSVGSRFFRLESQ